MKGGRRVFPIMAMGARVAEVPWEIFDACEWAEHRAQMNHSQTLSRLAERGGLDLVELACILADRPLFGPRSLGQGLGGGQRSPLYIAARTLAAIVEASARESFATSEATFHRDWRCETPDEFDAWKAVMKVYGKQTFIAEPVAKACQIRWCKSGQPATRSATECIDDGAWNVGVCQKCFDALGLERDGQDLPEASEVKRRVTNAG